MISRLRGTLLTRDTDRIEIATESGVVYEVLVPATVAGRLSPPGGELEILTAYVVKEDSATLYGFLSTHERELFRRVMLTKGVGPKTALNILSTFSAARLAQALAERDVNALTQVSGVGKKTAERMVVELADNIQDLALAAGGSGETQEGRKEAVSALVALGYSFSEADDAVSQVLEDGRPESTEELIRRALASR